MTEFFLYRLDCEDLAIAKFDMQLLAVLRPILILLEPAHSLCASISVSDVVIPDGN
jgi:hypothetical protein